MFTFSGLDLSSLAPFTAAGLIVTDGAGQVTNASAEDINDAGVASTLLALLGLILPQLADVPCSRSMASTMEPMGASATISSQRYPSSGGTQLLEIDNAGVTAGVAYPQTSTTLASGEGYGFNLTGINGGNGGGSFEEDDIAQFVNTSGSLTGIIDFNDQGMGTSYGQTFAAGFTADASIAGRGVMTPTTNSFNLVSYVVDGSTAVFVETDPSQLGLGSFGVQTSSARSNVAATHLAALHLKATPGKKSQRRRTK